MGLADELVNHGLVVSDERLGVIVGFLESQDFTCLDDFEGRLVIVRLCVHQLVRSVVAGAPPIGVVCGVEVLYDEEIGFLQQACADGGEACGCCLSLCVHRSLTRGR